MSFFHRVMSSQVTKSILGSNSLLWVFPLTATFGWILYPVLDTEWLQEMGLASDPNAELVRVSAARMARLQAHAAAKEAKKAKVTSSSSAAVVATKHKKEEDKEEEGEEPEEDAGAVEEEDAGAVEEEDEDGKESEEEEEAEPTAVKRLYYPIKGDKLTTEELWYNFTVKTIRLSDAEDEEEDEGTCCSIGLSISECVCAAFSFSQAF
jgi:hypothetical protein